MFSLVFVSNRKCEHCFTSFSNNDGGSSSSSSSSHKQICLSFRYVHAAVSRFDENYHFTIMNEPAIVDFHLKD